MEVYYIRKSEFFKNYDETFLSKFSDGRKYSSKDKELEHLLGLYLVKTVAKERYNLSDVNIIKSGDKPVFENVQNLYFSISHSNDIVICAFNSTNVGADIEQIKDRKDYLKILERFNQKSEGKLLDDFYKFWTKYEADYKLGEASNFSKTIIFEDYCLTVSTIDKVDNLEMIDFWATL